VSGAERFDADIVTRRSVDELRAHAKARGRRLRRRRRLLGAGLVTAAVLGAAGTVALAHNGGDRPAVHAGAGSTVSTPPAPVLSQRVAFVRLYDEGDAGSAILVFDPIGRDVRHVSTDRSWNDGSPAFSPDGAWIAFQSERDNPLRGIKRVTDIYVMRPDGSDVRRVTTTVDAGAGNGVRHPGWSPDGSSLVVAREDASDNSQIMVLRPDGGDARVISDGPGDVGPVWSPTGEWIAFRRRPAPSHEDLWVVRPDGSDAHKVHGPIHASPIAWTPDGTSLTFSADVGDGAIGLYTVRLDGSGVRHLAGPERGEAVSPVWSADGTLLVYSEDPDRRYLVSGDGTQHESDGREPGRLVVRTASGDSVSVLTEPRGGERDYSPSLEPHPQGFVAGS